MKHFLLIAFTLLAAACRQQQPSPPMQTAAFDWQGHRGARGLAPENAVPSFLKALEYPEITTLELDVVISRDSQVVVSHEPWMSAEICSRPDGSPVQKKEEESLNLFLMDYAEIALFDCGSRGHSRFPEQAPMPAAKPTLREVVEAVERYCVENNRPLPAYNIEIKSRPEWDNVKTPPPPAFTRLVVEEMRRLGIVERSNLQSFDPRILQEVRRMDSTFVTALLVENVRGLEANVKDLGYVPEIYSPYYKLVTAKTVRNAHAKGMRIIPWTVNETEEMKKLMELGVDGIITDYPDRVPD